MEAGSATGHGTRDGTRETEGDISMDEMRPRGKWTNRELNHVKFLVKNDFSVSKIGKFFGATKNAVIGALYRDKVRNGYVPSEEMVLSVQAHVRKVTAPYKYPRLVEFVTELPKTISGKIRRIELRDQEKKKD